MNRTSSCRRGGFSLVELLVATAILALLVVLLLQITSFMGSAWTGGLGKTEQRRNGRAMADFIARELRTAALPVGVPTNAAGSQTNLQFALNPAGVTAPFRHPSALFWQAPIATDSGAGDLAEIGYFVRWDTNGAAPAARLCRFFVNPRGASTNPWVNSNYTVYSDVEWVDDAKLSAVAPADAANGYRGLFVENAVGFWAKCFDAQGNLLAGADGSFDSRAATNSLPASMEISLALLDSRSAAKVTGAMRSRIESLVADSGDAPEFVEKTRTDSTLTALRQGFRAYTTKVFLENSR